MERQKIKIELLTEKNIDQVRMIQRDDVGEAFVDSVDIIYTAFKGKNNSSCQLLSKISGEKLFLTNSFEGLKCDITRISDTYSLVMMFGVDTNLKDMVRIERVAEYDGREETTKIDCEMIRKHMEENDVRCIISEVPTRFLCNAAYYHMLQKTDGKAVFIHIPSLKNMTETMMGKLVNLIENPTHL